jgi:hypothetical protein
MRKAGERLDHERGGALRGAWFRSSSASVLAAAGPLSFESESLDATHTPDSHCGR